MEDRMNMTPNERFALIRAASPGPTPASAAPPNARASSPRRRAPSQSIIPIPFPSQSSAGNSSAGWIVVLAALLLLWWVLAWYGDQVEEGRLL
jgi:hypothetical protein